MASLQALRCCVNINFSTTFFRETNTGLQLMTLLRYHSDCIMTPSLPPSILPNLPLTHFLSLFLSLPPSFTLPPSLPLSPPCYECVYAYLPFSVCQSCSLCRALSHSFFLSSLSFILPSPSFPDFSICLSLSLFSLFCSVVLACFS